LQAPCLKYLLFFLLNVFYIYGECFHKFIHVWGFREPSKELSPMTDFASPDTKR
jgi:hypothetical protein